MIQITNKSQCCGCTACFSICEHNAISMVMDGEGFLYPAVDLSACIRCGMCEDTCPYKGNGEKDREASSLHIAVQYKDERKRVESTAGGAFSLIADYVLEKKGVVYGVGYDDMIVCHKLADEEKDIREMRGSKYVQSTLKETFREICKFLNEKRTVLFVGTPCQVHGLNNYLMKKNCILDKLITIDLLCLGVSSPGIFEKWVKFLEERYGDKVCGVEFRNKRFGYAVTNVRIRFQNQRVLEQKFDTKAYIKTFFSGYNVRPSCYECKFRTMPRVSDFTIGDFIQIGDYSEEMDDDKGTTSLWAHTDKARQILEKVQGRFRRSEIEKECSNIIGGPQRQMRIPERRVEFFEDARQIPYDLFIRKWEPDSIRSRFASLVRITFDRFPWGKYVFRQMRRMQSRNFEKKVMRIQNGTVTEK